MSKTLYSQTPPTPPTFRANIHLCEGGLALQWEVVIATAHGPYPYTNFGHIQYRVLSNEGKCTLGVVRQLNALLERGSCQPLADLERQAVLKAMSAFKGQGIDIKKIQLVTKLSNHEDL